MALIDRLKKNVAAGFDRSARTEMKNERTLKRWEKIDRLEEENKAERAERIKMFRGDQPFSMKEFAKSKLREGKRNAQIYGTETFNRDNISAGAKSGLKSFGEKIAESERKYQESKPARQQSSKRFVQRAEREDFGGGIDIDSMVYGPRSDKQRYGSTFDVNEMVYGPRRQQQEGSYRKKSNKRQGPRQQKPRDMFDFSHLIDSDYL